MEFFAHDEVVARLERRAKSDSHDVANMVALAWQLRQRDCAKALTWAQQAEMLLVNGSYSHGMATLYALRIALVKAEVLWLKGEIDEAGQITKQVLQQPTTAQADDHDTLLCLQADAQWLLGSLHNERGQLEERDLHWQTMRQLLQQANNPEKVTDRLGFIDAMLASTISFRSTVDAEPLAQHYLASDFSAIALAARAAIDDFLGLQVRMGNDLGRAAMYWISAFDAYSKTGQVRRAIHTANNLGNWFNKLNDPDTALKWTSRALDLARPTDWPQPIASCLISSANCMRQMGKLDAAMPLLHEALEILVNLRGSRSYAISLWSLGDMALARDDYKTALDAFSRLQECADQLGQGDFQTTAMRGQAQALMLLGRFEEAMAVAEQALAMSARQNDVQGRIATLTIIAKIHAKHPFPAPADMQGASVPLHFLQIAYALAQEIDGYTIPGDLLDAIAAAHAEAGDFRAAYQYSLSANSAREKTNSVAATNRANAVQIQHQAERARAESEHLRELAQEQAQRAQVLQNTSATLSHLGAIGQEITAQLDPEAVCNTIKRHVQNLLDVSYFAIYLLDADGEHLSSIIRIQHTETLPAIKIALQDLNSHAALCARMQREILISSSETIEQATAAQDEDAMAQETAPCPSAMFGPLATGKRNLGVMTIQSNQAEAYGERDELIFRNLCSYGAIALDNAYAYKKLQEAQIQLVEQEKLAALGSLVAGVAHELNTPLGNSLVTATGLQDYGDQLQMQLENQSLRLIDLEEFIARQREGMDLILRGLHSAANLVVSFKQVAADRTTAQRRFFDLQQTTQEVVATMNSHIRADGHRIHVDIPANIQLDSYPGPYGQVITSLINNAVCHAFPHRQPGQITLCATQPKAGRVLITFADNGVGIEACNLKRIFDPFFTTRLGHGGNGLGLSISYNIVTSMLQGQISVESNEGEGAVFMLDLPLTVAS